MIPYKINPIFIPIFNLPGMMEFDNSKYFKEYNFLHIDNLKSSNPIGIIDKKAGRAIIEVAIRPPIKKTTRLQQNDQRVEQVIVHALIDTGAQISAINKSAFKYLKERSFKGAWIAGMNKEPIQGRNANLSIHLLNRSTGFLDICPIITNWGSEEPFDFIIGWDVLKYCNLSYNGKDNTFELQFIGNEKEPE